MLIIGAKGFAKEVLEVYYQLNEINNIAFYDDINKGIGDVLFDRFPILQNEIQVKEYFSKIGCQFTIGIGNPKLRYQLYNKFIDLGGKYTSSISPSAVIGNYGNKISEGVNLMTNTIITSSVTIGKGTLINLACTIGHDCKIEEFVEICPNVNISGNCKIGAFTFIGTNAIILPNITIGKNVVIGAGALVTKNIPDNEIWVGSPAKLLKRKNDFTI